MFFFPQIVDATEIISRLNALLASCAGDAAWRARGLMAPSLEHAFKRSIGVVGESVVAFIHTHRARGVTHSGCATLHVTRDAASRVVHAEITACGVPDSGLEARTTVRRAVRRDARSKARADWKVRFAFRLQVRCRTAGQLAAPECT